MPVIKKPIVKPARRVKRARPVVSARGGWVLYVLRCRDDTLYCGITNDLPRRLEQHQRGRAARYTRGRGPVVLLKSWTAAGVSAALKAERAFKKLGRTEKEKRIRSRGRSDEIARLLRGG